MNKINVLVYLIGSVLIIYFSFRGLRATEKETRITFMGLIIALFFTPLFKFGGYLGIGGGLATPVLIIIQIIFNLDISSTIINTGNWLGNLIIFSIFFGIYTFVYYLIDNVISIKN